MINLEAVNRRLATMVELVAALKQEYAAMGADLGVGVSAEPKSSGKVIEIDLDLTKYSPPPPAGWSPGDRSPRRPVEPLEPAANLRSDDSRALVPSVHRRSEIVGWFVRQRGWFATNTIASALKRNPRITRRELAALEEAGQLVSRSSGSRQYWRRANDTSNTTPKVFLDKRPVKKTTRSRSVTRLPVPQPKQYSAENARRWYYESKQASPTTKEICDGLYNTIAQYNEPISVPGLLKLGGQNEYRTRMSVQHLLSTGKIGFVSDGNSVRYIVADK